MSRKSEYRDMRHELDIIKTILTVSNPQSPIAAEAFDGLRKSVVHAATSSQVLLAVLAQLDQVASSGDNIDDVRVKLRELMEQYGLHKVTAYEAMPQAFDRTGRGDTATVTKPAYVAGEGQLVIRGSAAMSNDRQVVPAHEQISDSDRVEPAGDESHDESESQATDSVEVTVNEQEDQ